MAKINEFAEKLCNDLREATGADIYIDGHYDSFFDMSIPYLNRSVVDCELAVEEMLNETHFHGKMIDLDTAFVIAAGNEVRTLHNEDCDLARYIIDTVRDYYDLLPENEPDELCYVRMEVEDKLADWYDEAIDAIIERANDLIGNRLENPLSLYTEDELLAELRRRDHFELSYATPNLIREMNPEAYSWAVLNDRVYDLIDEWKETYADMADWDNLDSESLGEAAMKLGFEPED